MKYRTASVCCINEYKVEVKNFAKTYIRLYSKYVVSMLI